MSNSPKDDDAASFEDMPTATVYDVFSDVGTQLSAIYVELSENASTEEERAGWWAKVMALRDHKRSVPARDRDALLAHIMQWRAEIRGFQAR